MKAESSFMPAATDLYQPTAKVSAAKSAATTGFLALLRPPNLVTAAADILAGSAAAGSYTPGILALLIFSSIALYAGGVTLNDFFDRHLDAIERPERPIPSGRVSARWASVTGWMMLCIGILAGTFASATSGIIAAVIACCAVVYDALGKHHRVQGPVLMGTCRGLNLLLGLSAAPAICGERWFLVLLPLAYIGSITSLSAYEVKGGNRQVCLLAIVLVTAVCAGVALLGLSPGFSLIWASPVLLLFGYRVLPGLWRAYRNPAAANVRMAVKSGVLSIIVFDSALAAGFAGPWHGAAVLGLLGVAAILARAFSVT